MKPDETRLTTLLTNVHSCLESKRAPGKRTTESPPVNLHQLNARAVSTKALFPRQQISSEAGGARTGITSLPKTSYNPSSCMSSCQTRCGTHKSSPQALGWTAPKGKLRSAQKCAASISPRVQLARDDWLSQEVVSALLLSSTSRRLELNTPPSTSTSTPRFERNRKLTHSMAQLQAEIKELNEIQERRKQLATEMALIKDTLRDSFSR